MAPAGQPPGSERRAHPALLTPKSTTNCAAVGAETETAGMGASRSARTGCTACHERIAPASSASGTTDVVSHEERLKAPEDHPGISCDIT